MREPAFWWRPAGAAAAALTPLAAVYAGVAARRMAQPGARAGVPVICVGNPTVGGAGKTPTALAVADILLAEGKRPVFLTRGYGGRLKGPVRVEPAAHSAADLGDEPLLLARLAPTIVAADRVAGAAAAREVGADVIVMDDGFQNPSLAKDLSVLVVDGRRRIGNGCVLPAGPLRVPLEAQLDRADAMLVIGGEGGAVAAAAQRRGLALFHGRLEPDAQAVAVLREKPALAFAGIGDPSKFFATLADAGIAVRATRAFADHHRYTTADTDALLAEARRAGLSLVTTEKDRVRLSGEIAAAASALPVRLVVAEADSFRALLLSRL